MYLCAFGGLLALLGASGVAQAQRVIIRVPRLGEVGRPQPGISRAELARAAHTLSEQAEHFHEVSHDLTGFSHLGRDAHQFAQSAEHFHQAVERGSNPGHVMGDYQQLRREYLHLREAFRRAHDAHHNRHAQRDWDRLSRAFDEVRWLIEEHATDDHDH